MNVLINGISGFMGREVAKLCKNGYRGSALYAGVDPNAVGSECGLIYKSFDEISDTSAVDCIVDFSHHSVTPALLDFSIANNLPLVLATTGHTDVIISVNEFLKLCFGILFVTQLTSLDAYFGHLIHSYCKA